MTLRDGGARYPAARDIKEKAMPQPRNPENEVLAVKIAALRKKHVTFKEIAKELGISYGRVNYIHFGGVVKKHRERAVKENVNGHSENVGTDGTQEAAIAFAAGHCVAWLEVYAHSQQIPGAVLASRVGKLLQAGKNR